MYQFSLGLQPFPQHWRNLAEYWHLSSSAKQRLEWMIFYYTVGKKKARATALYFGISPKTFHKWKKRFNPKIIQSLEEKSKAPLKRRVWEVTKEQETRVKTLREKHLKYGKKKLKVLSLKQYHEDISAWKIERVVRKHQLYPDPFEHQKRTKRLKNKAKRPKIRINKLKDFGFLPKPGKLWHTDSIILDWYGQRRIIFTAIEDQTKLGYARVYLTGSSRQAKDFLERLVYLSEGDIKIIHSDNGKEFAGEFEKACWQLGYPTDLFQSENP